MVVKGFPQPGSVAGEFNEKKKFQRFVTSPRSWCVRVLLRWSLSADSPFPFGQVCDEPHPLLVKEMIQHCVNANIEEAYKVCFFRLP